MSGFFGFGQSGGEKASTAGINSVFNYALPQAQQNQSAGANNLSSAAGTFQSLIAPGRTAATLNAAPATNAAVDQADATRRQEAATGTSRGGGTAGANREASATTNKTVDDIINQNLMGGKVAGAQGLAGIGQGQQSNAAQLLGIGQQGQESLYSGAISKEGAQSSGIGNLFGEAIDSASQFGLAKAFGLV